MNTRRKEAPEARGGKRAGRRAADPFYAREASRYAEPLPSREFILQVLESEAVPVDERRLARLVGIKRQEFEAFARRLGAMERDGQILRNRKGAVLVAQKVDVVRGRVEAHPDGYGFVAPDDGSDDLYLPPSEMKQVMHGDGVLAQPSGHDRRGRREARIVEVVERARSRIVGRLHVERGVAFVAAADRRIQHDVLIEPGAAGGAKPGQIVTAEIVVQPGLTTQPIGRVVEILGAHDDPGMEIEIALRKHELPFEFSPEATRLAARLPRAVRATDIAGRTDLREFPFVTIDGETARDFDDAALCEREGRGFRLRVAIADVSYYVQPNDALDLEARNRGNSVYFPRRVIPMLPERLSNGLCSLNPDEDRLTMVCDMSVSSRGEIERYEFYAAAIRSHARLTYNQVARALYEKPAAADGVVAPLLGRLEALDQVFRALLTARARRGAIDFETVETVLEFDVRGKIARIVPAPRNDAHRLIEECMLAANVCASDFLQKRGHKALYRIHEGPTPEKLEALRQFLKSFGLHLGGGDEPHAKEYAKLLTQVKKRPDVLLLQTVLLRSLQQAVYSPENVGHFGLAYESYTHFTSPIRRYPDLVIHRAIKAALAGQIYAPGKWDDLGKHCSMTERRADEATRDVQSWLKCYYMRGRVGEEFDGSISAVTGFGIFVALDDVYVEGLVHISELGSDYFRFDAVHHALRGERTGKTFRLADRVRVRVVRVDLELGRIDFVPA
ncbi:MAG TPA: ribonuclease R [Burkholderiales bacterium]|nr:ribonuclease R [Burkholderiales bacterium]